MMQEKKDKTIQYIEEFLQEDYSSLKEHLEELIKKYQRKSKRLDRIIKQSDSQHHALMTLNNTITEQKEQLDTLHAYNIQQQNIAKEKLDLTIVNNLSESKVYQTDIIYKPSDILSGDFYSLYTLQDGSTLAYILDGQGHGISPALSVFAVSSTIASLVDSVVDFEDFIQKLFPKIQNFLGEEEQLTYIMLNIMPDGKILHYVGGGIYPFLVQNNEGIEKHKANNLPFMNFSPIPVTKSITTDWDKIFLYTDGLVEDLDEGLEEYTPKVLINDIEKFDKVREIIQMGSYEDDITVIKIVKK
jgi:serine phosphatase RsbU (regulator of sigma subunit)